MARRISAVCPQTLSYSEAGEEGDVNDMEIGAAEEMTEIMSAAAMEMCVDVMEMC